jgi:murein DD-endopeptidase MepM/ murein hydrolase activator NlpD
VLTRKGDQWLPTLEQVELQKAARMGSGTIQTTLFAATDDARIPDDVAVKLAEIFASEIDFHRDIHRGDRFTVLYEAMMADGEPVGWAQSPGRIMAAEFANRGKLHQAMWFATGPGGKGEYFSFDGRSHRRAFLASPLEFSRVSSGFAMRVHPLSKTWRAHLGVDYAAPTGTAVRTVGDGIVEFAGRQSGYGNVVQIKHRGENSTLYAHLSSIDVQVGQKVEQGQLIGAVGATGWATGPHLHFEFRVKGVHQDPQTLAQVAEAAVLDAAAKQRFGTLRASYQVQLQAAASLGGTRARFE